MSQRNFWAAAVMVTSTFSALAARAQEPAPEPAAKPVPLAERGPRVGSRIPDFKARDQFGVERDLGSLTGPNGLVILFVRSADW